MQIIRSNKECGYYFSSEFSLGAIIQRGGSVAKKFQFGVGYIPTVLINNGILGMLAWLSFLIVLFFLGIKTLLKKEKHDERAKAVNEKQIHQATG